ncbi:LysM peptidoglycan-binding domain-containing protein [Arcanobacterium phocae]|uniref:LysM peptidoglycan-binding domain-containing protein n=1 Tax=Arcanobacterium phocae TaxID=131112 RepID=UPI001C0F2967|nr:LysM peptidoglycan-binding domain-containing protein [Arcanobacterium phocae]
MSVVDMREYNVREKDARHRAKPLLKAVRTPVQPISDRVRTPRRTIRPDRPQSNGCGFLYAVPSAQTPAYISDGDTQWVVANRAHALDETGRHVARISSLEMNSLSFQMQSGYEQLREMIVSLQLRKVFQFIGLMAMSVVAGLAVVEIFDLAPDSGQIRVVQPGETVASIASSLDAPVDPSQIIADIYALNALDGGLIQPGQELVLPQY